MPQGLLGLGKKFWAFLMQSGLWIPLLFWLALFTWRPFVLGFYYDDWLTLVDTAQRTPPFSLQKLMHLLWLFADRPMMAPFHFFFNSICGTSYQYWHTSVILLTLAFIPVFQASLVSIFDLFGLRSRKVDYACSTAASGWLFLPWLQGAEAWPILFPLPILNSFFALSGYFLFKGWRQGRNPIIVPVLFFAAQALMYEYYYFQFALFFAIGILAGIHRTISWKQLLSSFSVFSAVQLFIVFINRSSSPRAVIPYWPQVFLKGVLNMPGILLKSTHEVKSVVVVLFFLLLLAAIFGAVDKFNRLKQTSPSEAQMRLTQIMGLLVIALAGLLMSVGLLSLGNRVLRSVGTFARSTISVSFWLTSASVLLFYFASTLRQNWLKVSQVTIVALCSTLGIATVLRIIDYAKAWQEERAIAMAAPIRRIQALGPSAAVIYKGPIHYNGVYVYYMSYTLSGAMNYFHPELRLPWAMTDALPVTLNGLVQEAIATQKNPAARNSLDERRRQWRTFWVLGNHDIVWDGKHVESQGHQSVTPITELWEWDYNRKTFRLLKAPIRLLGKPLKM